MNFDQNYYKQLGRDLKLSAEENRSIHLNKMDKIRRQEDFGLVYRLFWVLVASVAIIAIGFKYIHH